MPLYSYAGKSPRIGKNCFIAPNASIIGDVVIGDNCSIWFGTVIRGDTNAIRIGEGTNIQDNCIVHGNTDKSTSIGSYVTIGHGALVHACDVKDRALIGSKSIIHDHAVIGEQSLIAPGCVVTDRTIIPPRSLVMGMPGKIKRELVDEDFKRMKLNNDRYLNLKDRYLKEFKLVKD